MWNELTVTTSICLLYDLKENWELTQYKGQHFYASLDDSLELCTWWCELGNTCFLHKQLHHRIQSAIVNSTGLIKFIPRSEGNSGWSRMASSRYSQVFAYFCSLARYCIKVSDSSCSALWNLYLSATIFGFGFTCYARVSTDKFLET